MDVRKLEFDQLASRPSIELRESVFFFSMDGFKIQTKKKECGWLVG